MPLPHQPKPKKYETCRQYVHTDGIRKTRSIVVRQFPMFLSFLSQSVSAAPVLSELGKEVDCFPHCRLPEARIARDEASDLKIRTAYCLELSASSVPMVAYRELKLAPFLDGIKRGPRKRSFLLSSPFAHFFSDVYKLPFPRTLRRPSPPRFYFFPSTSSQFLAFASSPSHARLPDASPSAYTPSFFTKIGAHTFSPHLHVVVVKAKNCGRGARFAERRTDVYTKANQL